MTDRAVRNLEHLKSSASTARVLNLLRVWEENGDSAPDGAVRNPDWAARPIFRTPALNRALIIKHRLRRNETDLFTGRRLAALARDAGVPTGALPAPPPLTDSTANASSGW